MPRQKHNLSRKTLLVQPTEGIDSAWNIGPEIDVKDGEFCMKHIIAAVLKLGQTAETQAIHSQYGFQKYLHQFTEVFTVVQEHNSRPHFDLKAV